MESALPTRRCAFMIAHINCPHRRALLVEDSAVNQKVLSLMLEHEGFEVVLAVNGQEAVEKFKEQDFDVVIMDVEMPVMDGLEATRLIRKLEGESTHHTPIVAATAGMDRDSCLGAGMNDYIAKPVRIPILHEVLGRSCSRPMAQEPGDQTW